VVAPGGGDGSEGDRDGFAAGEPVDTPRRPRHPAQKRLVAALTVSAEPTPEAQYRRRRNAICAIIDYCSVEEGFSRSHTATLKASIRRPEDAKPDSPLYAAAMSVFVSTATERPRRWFVCVGQAMALVPDDL
jgi:hypothetical protein